MAAIWLTYSWADNKSGDIDYFAQELMGAGLDVNLDRWNIGAGNRLWEQIEQFIVDPSKSDAWLFFATQNSLNSEPCREEYAYALDRALRSRGAKYPVIALFQGQVDETLLPAGIRTRLYVSATDPDWKERIVAAAEGRQPRTISNSPEPYHLKVHQTPERSKPFAIEVRPRAGVWSPFFAAIPLNEKDVVLPSIMIGPRDRPTDSGMLLMGSEGANRDHTHWVISAQNQSTPTESYYVWCNQLPTSIAFGSDGPNTQFEKVLI